MQLQNYANRCLLFYAPVKKDLDTPQNDGNFRLIGALREDFFHVRNSRMTSNLASRENISFYSSGSFLRALTKI